MTSCPSQFGTTNLIPASELSFVVNQSTANRFSSFNTNGILPISSAVSVGNLYQFNILAVTTTSSGWCCSADMGATRQCNPSIFCDTVNPGTKMYAFPGPPSGEKHSGHTETIAGCRSRHAVTKRRGGDCWSTVRIMCNLNVT